LVTNKKDVVVTPLDEEVPQELASILNSFDSSIEEEEPAIKAIPTVVKLKLVKVMALRKFTSCVGKTWYYGEKNKTLLVPQSVADLWLKDTKRPKIRIV
jgi:hypothetical protein